MKICKPPAAECLLSAQFARLGVVTRRTVLTPLGNWREARTGELALVMLDLAIRTGLEGTMQLAQEVGVDNYLVRDWVDAERDKREKALVKMLADLELTDATGLQRPAPVVVVVKTENAECGAEQFDCMTTFRTLSPLLRELASGVLMTQTSNKRWRAVHPDEHDLLAVELMDREDFVGVRHMLNIGADPRLVAEYLLADHPMFAEILYHPGVALHILNCPDTSPALVDTCRSVVAKFVATEVLAS